MKKQILEAMLRKWKAELARRKVNIDVALANPMSVPDHYEVVGDLGPQVEALEKAESMIATLEGLLGE